MANTVFGGSMSDFIHAGPQAINDLSSILNVRGKSITRGAKDSTFQFPCLISTSVPVDLVDVTRQLLDKTYAAFTQSWLSMNQMFDITIDPTPISYLKRLHQNLSLESAKDDMDAITITEKEDLDRYTKKVFDGDALIYMNESKDFGIIFNTKDKGLHDIMESNKDLLREYMSDFDLKPLVPVTEEVGDTLSYNDFARAAVNGIIAQGQDNEREAMRKMTAYSRMMTPQLTNRDIKRSNEVIPYGIEVRLVAVNDRKQFVQYIDVVIGIKTVLHLVNTEDMTENIARALQNKSFLLRAFKWTTGEISLVKDLIFNLNDVKQDALARANGRVPYFGALKRLRDRRFGIRNLTVPTALIPNATIVITNYELENLRNKYAVDLADTRTAKKLLDALFLIGLIILDEGNNSMTVLFDGSSSFETYSIESLERENELAATKNTLSKEIGRMIAR